MKRGLSLFLGMLFLAHFIGSAQTFSGGDGSILDPFQISTKSELLTVKNYSTYNYILTNDIDFLGDANYKSHIINSMTGNFDGNGHKISNLTFEGGYSIFGTINTGSTVKNLYLEKVLFTFYFYSSTTDSRNQYHAPLAYTNNGTIEECSYTSDTELTSYSRVAGITLTNNGKIKNCYVNANLTTPDGMNVSYNTFPGKYAGGIAVTNSSGASIENCYYVGNITVGDNTAGGIAYSNAGTISSCFSFAGSMRSTWYNYAVHRVSGSNTGTLTNNYARSQMTLNGSTTTSTDATSIEGEDIDGSLSNQTSTYTDQGWDLSSIWEIKTSATYPTLRAPSAGTPTNVDNNKFEKVIVKYNHKSGIITILYPQNDKINTVEIYDIVGKRVIKKIVHQKTVNINLHSIKKGIYIVNTGMSVKEILVK